MRVTSTGTGCQLFTKNRFCFEGAAMATKRAPQKDTVKEQHKEPGFCPFCKEGMLTASPSGVNFLCPKCWRIVICENMARAE